MAPRSEPWGISESEGTAWQFGEGQAKGERLAAASTIFVSPVSEREMEENERGGCAGGRARVGAAEWKLLSELGLTAAEGKRI